MRRAFSYANVNGAKNLFLYGVNRFLSTATGDIKTATKAATKVVQYTITMRGHPELLNTIGEAITEVTKILPSSAVITKVINFSGGYNSYADHGSSLMGSVSSTPHTEHGSLAGDYFPEK